MFRLKVREVALSKNISQSRLGRMADIDTKTMSQIFNKPFESITLYVLDKVAVALDVDISELIESIPTSSE